MANEPKKSKYIKSDSDKTTSKYIRSDGNQKKSKYLKSDADRLAEKEKRANRYASSTSYRKNAASTNLSNRTASARPEIKKTNKPNTELKLPKEVTSLDEVRESKGDQSSIFTNEQADKNAYRHYKEVEETPDDNRRATQIVRTGLIIAGLLIVAIAINFIVVNQNGEIKYLPTFLSVEFSAIPEFIATLAYGPVVGVVIVLIKNVVHMIFNQPSFVSEISNFILDSFFIFLGGWIYTRRMFNFKPATQKVVKGKDYRTRRILFAGFIGTVVTTFASFFTTRFFAYPLLIRLYSKQYDNNLDGLILQSYQDAVDNIREAAPAFGKLLPDIGVSFSKAILSFNVPITFVKLIFITIIVALLYPPISDFLHYRVKSKRRK